MAVAKVLARDWKLEIDTGSGTPTWTEVKGLKSFEFSNGMKEVDDTDFDSNGVEEHKVASRNKSVKVECFFLEDTGGTRDPGQAAIETLAAAVGDLSLDSFKLTSPKGKTYTFKASANIGAFGGGNDDNTSFNFDLKVSGAVTVA